MGQTGQMVYTGDENGGRKGEELTAPTVVESGDAEAVALTRTGRIVGSSTFLLLRDWIQIILQGRGWEPLAYSRRLP